MRKIPPKLREEMANDVYYYKCCIASQDCRGAIEWHHNLIFANKQVNEMFCILPLCHYHHDIEKRRDIKERLNYIMLNRATHEQLKKYGREKEWVRLTMKHQTIAK